MDRYCSYGFFLLVLVLALHSYIPSVGAEKRRPVMNPAPADTETPRNSKPQTRWFIYTTSGTCTG